MERLSGNVEQLLARRFRGRHCGDGQRAAAQTRRHARGHRGEGRERALSPGPRSTPIEKFFSKFKSILKRIAARTAADALEEAVTEALRSFSPEECSNHSPHPATMRFDRTTL